jgi:hypothetical protein
MAHKSACVPESKCLSCGKVLDRATNMFDGGWRPSPGDYSICIACGHLMIFADDLRLRELTVMECVEIAGDKRLLALRRVRGFV